MSTVFPLTKLFHRASVNGLEKDDWYTTATPQQLVDTFPTLDSRLRTAFLHATDIHVWRLYVHLPYPYWVRGRTAILGDAAHPMLPDQAQGFGMAIEDAAALGLVFSRDYLGNGEQGIKTALTRYEKVRKERATRVQDASLRASTDLSERIGWSTGNERPGKMTIEDLCNYEMEAHLKQVIAAELQM
jgi:salicylate hydroxylase